MKRYTHCVPTEVLYALGVSMTERDDGEYVTYSDHESALATAVNNSINTIAALQGDLSAEREKTEAANRRIEQLEAMRNDDAFGGALSDELAKTRIAELERQLAEAERDAKRYRWLRNQPATASIRVEREDCNEDGPTETWYATAGAELDAVIDEALDDAAIDSAKGEAL